MKSTKPHLNGKSASTKEQRVIDKSLNTKRIKKGKAGNGRSPRT